MGGSKKAPPSTLMIFIYILFFPVFILYWIVKWGIVLIFYIIEKIRKKADESSSMTETQKVDEKATITETPKVTEKAYMTETPKVDEKPKLKYVNVSEVLTEDMEHSITLNNEADKKRLSIACMPELKFKPLTKSTNLEKINTFVVIDTETTGIKLGGNRIIEFSAIKFISNEPVAYMSTLINPKMEIPKDATEINNITNEMVVECPEFYQIKDSFKDFIGNAPIVGHNISFDIRHLFVSGLDLSEHKMIYDTYSIARTKFKKYDDRAYEKAEEYDREYNWDVYDYKLSTVCELYNIRVEATHRALADCYATGMLFIKMIEDFCT